ncbi:MAG TPA: hypothetical protein VMZ30_20445 [Pyrinomonadaceae bacterium]|nr:hypothetical protein [Pyrinomonadaceae bacterium]
MKTLKACWNIRSYPVGSTRSKTTVLVSILLIFLLTPDAFFGQHAPVQDQPASSATPHHTFRIERVPVAGGAELITIRARMDGIAPTEAGNWVPTVSVLRDTLGDLSPENDRLRYLWPLSYTRPTLRQRLFGAVPFLYSRVGNKKSASQKAPPPILDLAASDRDVWDKIFWSALQTLLLDPYGVPIKAATRSYRQNLGDYRKSHIIRALSVLSLYQAIEGPPAFSDSELSQIQARLRLTDKTFGGLVVDLDLERYNNKEITNLRDTRGHNWELLRQRAEAESLFFEPLQMSDGSTTHALLWIARSDLATNAGKHYDSRFLNIANPWSDKRLHLWRGYSETRFFDSANRPVSSDTAGAHAMEMIPLALYGLDNPKIPTLLIDFRDVSNPKKREMSRRVLQDITRNVLSVSKFGDLFYFLGRTVLDFVTGKRGIDLNQPSRLRTYSQLKLLLSLNQSLDSELRDQIGDRLERVSLNPLENDLQFEAKLAAEQYEALLRYAKRPDGLPLKLSQDRRAEMVALEHGRKEQVLFRLANILTIGKYTHREKADPEMETKLDIARRLSYHTRFLKEVARSSPQVDVVWDLDEIKRSLKFVADHGSNATSESATAAATIFVRTHDSDTRHSCLETLSRMDNHKAKSELHKLYRSKELDQAGRDLIASFLAAPRQTEPMSVSSEKSSGTRVNQ